VANDGDERVFLTTQALTVLTISAAAGSIGNGAATTATAGSGYAYHCQGSSTTWFQMYYGNGGAVSSVANSDGTLTISPTTGAVVASLALGHANTWTAAQTVTSNLTVSGKLIFTGASPTITAGTATLDATASNQAGTVTEGTAQTGFTLTFNATNPFTTTPHCTVTSPNGASYTGYTPSTTTLVVANLTATGSIFTYACLQ
jgi:hypothetical protein